MNLTKPLLVLAFTLPLGDASRMLAQTTPVPAEVAVVQPSHLTQPHTLAEVVSEIRWKPDQQGVLLIVAPTLTRPANVPRHVQQVDGFYTEAPFDALPPSEIALPTRGDEGLDVAQLESYFGRRVIPCGNVTVLAPAKMTVLNYTNLPKPSASNGLQPADDFRLLQLSFSEAQWQQFGSEQGIGLSDLQTSEQRELFLGALPPKLRVAQEMGEQLKALPVSESQRRGIRMHMARIMRCSFRMPDGNFVSAGYTGQKQTGPRLQVLREDSFTGQRKQAIFGVEFASEVAARAKPGQLPFDWDALNVPVSLDGVQTVGDLLDQVRKTTRVEVYGDTRYTRLPVYLRGDKAQAGNLLRALSRGVAGTYRRVGDAYILTNDVVGLATRYELIRDWINANLILAYAADWKLSKSLAEAKPSRFVNFDASDPLKPGNAVMKQFEENQALLRAPRKSGEPPPTTKVFAVKDFPPETQDAIRALATNMQKGDYGDYYKDIIPDGVILSFSTSFQWSVPDIGIAVAPYDLGIENLEQKFSATTAPSTPSKRNTYPLPSFLPTRALVVRWGKVEDIASVITAAHHAGFTEVWLEVDAAQAEPREMLEQVVQQAKQADLGTRLLIRDRQTQPTKEGKPSGIDLNVLGETSTQYGMRIRSTGAFPGIFWLQPGHNPEEINSAIAALQTQQARGNWFEPGSPEGTEYLTTTLEKLSKVPGLKGFVVSDLLPPGYPSDLNHSNPGQQYPSGFQGGYTASQRLAFLRKFNVDPVDISLHGSYFSAPSLRFHEESWAQVLIPLFEDYGPSAVLSNMNGRKASEIGIGGAMKEWRQFRGNRGTTALIPLRKTLAAMPLPILYYNNRGDTSVYPYGSATVESLDKTAPNAETQDGRLPNRNHVDFPSQPTAEQRARSSTVLYATEVPQVSANFDALVDLSLYYFDPKWARLKDWDGIVVDMSNETLPEVARRIGALPTMTAPEVPATSTKPPSVR